MSDLVIIKCSCFIRHDELRRLWADFVEMKKEGVIVLPVGCELVNEVPPNPEIVVIGEEKPGGL